MAFNYFFIITETNSALHQEKVELMAISTENLLAEKQQRKIIEEKLDEISSPTKNNPNAKPASKSGETEFISVKGISVSFSENYLSYRFLVNGKIRSWVC